MLDAKLIAAHQWIVDQTEKKPNWWAEQTAWAYAVCGIVVRVATWAAGVDAIMLLLILIVGAGLVYASRQEALLKSICSATWIRPFFLFLTVMNAFTLIMVYSPQSVLHLLSSIALLSFYCFGACENPRPKKRKEKLVLKTAS